MAPSAEKRCPISGKVGLCPMARMAAKDPMLQAEKAEETKSDVQAGKEHLERKEHVKALKAFSRAFDEDPCDKEACIGKVSALRLLNRPRGALKACRLGLEALPACRELLDASRALQEELGDEEIADVEHDSANSPQGASESNEESSDEAGESGEEAPACPAARSQAFAQRQAKELGARRARVADLEVQGARLRSEESAPFRQALKEDLIDFYRDFYAKTKAPSVDTSQYSKAEKQGLSIKGGHRPMPRPEQVLLPEDYQEPVGTLTSEELASFSCNSDRLLLCVHGDIFDVSDRPDKYGPQGPYHSMAGHDITWALWSGYDDEAEWDKYFDLLQAQPREERDRRFQGLMSWWAFFEQEYGQPVGRLEAYEREWELDAPPAVKDLCTVM